MDIIYGYDIFISYAHADGSLYARSLVEKLESEPFNFRVNIDVRDYRF